MIDHPLPADVLAQYRSLTGGAGLCELPGRTQLELTGPDRAAFLHNLCTQNVKPLPPGTGAEAFITNVQGKILGHVYLFVGEKSLIIDTVPGQGPALLTHLERYHIREKVEMYDRTEEWQELLVSGPRAGEILTRLAGDSLPALHGAHRPLPWEHERVWLRRIDLAGPHSYLLSLRREVAEPVRSRLLQEGLDACGEQAFEMARLEQGTPFFGFDITPENLPQEVDRNEQAISFVKGCYLGQETVARIDALGHVNRLLVRLRCEAAAVPARGQELTGAGKTVGKITSAAPSPDPGVYFALAYVRREHASPTSEFSWPNGRGKVMRKGEG